MANYPLRLQTLALSFLIVSGCGSDSGSSDPAPLAGIPRPISNDESTSGPASSDSTSQDSNTSDAGPAPDSTASSTGTDSDPVDNNSGMSAEPDPAPENMGMPGDSGLMPDNTSTPTPPESTFGMNDVRNLIGRVRFEFSFSDSSDVFTLEKTFAESDGGVDPLNGLPFVQTGVGSDVVTRCSVIPGEFPYFCAEATAESATTVSFRLFRFTLDATGNGSGTFEFCPAGTGVSVCTADAFTTPDGQVSVTVNAGNIAASRPVNTRQQHIVVDVMAHHLVAEQSQVIRSPADASQRSAAIREVIDLLQPSLRALHRASLLQ